MKLKGLETVVTNLNRELRAIEGRTFEGMRAVGLFIQSEAQPITPRKLGTLRNSAFTDTIEINNKIVTRVGYTAEYAAYVHEMPETNTFTEPGTGPKFLEKAISQNIREIMGVLQARAKIPGTPTAGDS